MESVLDTLSRRENALAESGALAMSVAVRGLNAASGGTGFKWLHERNKKETE